MADSLGACCPLRVFSIISEAKFCCIQFIYHSAWSGRESGQTTVNTRGSVPYLSSDSTLTHDCRTPYDAVAAREAGSRPAAARRALLRADYQQTGQLCSSAFHFVQGLIQGCGSQFGSRPAAAGGALLGVESRRPKPRRARHRDRGHSLGVSLL